MSENFDIIAIGSGHYGLVAARACEGLGIDLDRIGAGALSNGAGTMQHTRRFRKRPGGRGRSIDPARPGEPLRYGIHA